jgi:hypothetical protein
MVLLSTNSYTPLIPVWLNHGGYSQIRKRMDFTLRGNPYVRFILVSFVDKIASIFRAEGCVKLIEVANSRYDLIQRELFLLHPDIYQTHLKSH